MLKKWLALCFMSMFMLVACNSPVYNQTEGNVADVKTKVTEARKKSDDSVKVQPSLLVKKGLYVDTSPINLERQPSWLDNNIVIRGDQLPFSYYSRTISAGAGNSVLTKYQNGMDATTKVTISYTGTVKGALDLLATKTGYVYNVRGKSIFWQAFVTKTFDIAFMPGGTDYLMGNTSTGGAAATGGTGTTTDTTSSSSSESEFSSLKGSINLWTDLDTTIKQLLSKEGTVSVSQSTTSLTVRDRPGNVEIVSQYIANMNRTLSKQVLVKVQILDVKLEQGYNFGIDWNLIANAFHNSPFVLNGNYGTPVAITALTAQGASAASGAALTTPQFGTERLKDSGIPGWTVLFNALNQQGKTSVVTEPRVVCLNNQVSVIRIIRTEGYVASVENTALSSSTSGSSSSAAIGSVTSSVTPGSFTTGLTLYILPKILNDKVFLQVNADISVKDALKEFGSGTSTVQLPTLSEKHFNQRSVIRSGDTMILSGFRAVANASGANQLLTSQALGGKAAAQESFETIILITPIILAGSA